ncbi:MAG: DUF222 domain-containing protein, partial [Acidimicrobiia bacterium]
MFELLRSTLATLEAVVGELEPGTVDASGAVTLVDVFARIEKLGAAGKALAVLRVDETGAYRRDGHKSTADWLAARTGTTSGAAFGVVATVQSLRELPATNAAFRAGELSETQARVITSTARRAPEREGELVATARKTTVKGLRDTCARVSAAAEPDDAAWARRLHESRYHRKWTATDGAACGQYRLTPEAAARFWAALGDHQDRIFRSARKEGRREPADAYAADALVALATDGPCKPIETRLLADATAIERGHVEAGERCELVGVGPVSVTAARALLTDSRVVTMLTDGPDITAVSSPNRTIPAALRRYLETAYPTCGVEGCDAEWNLKIDHVVPYDDVRETTQDNTWRICGHHHDLKTYFGWTVTGGPGTWNLVPPDGW